MHALLFRSWKNRVKGRDWYDFEWYVRNNTALNFEHLCQRTSQLGSLPEEELTRDNFIQLLRDKISKTNMELVKADVRPFIKNPGEMDIWSSEYFMHLADMIRFEKQDLNRKWLFYRINSTVSNCSPIMQGNGINNLIGSILEINNLSVYL